MAGRKAKASLPPVPSELATYLADRLRLMEAQMIEISECASDDEAAWCLYVLDRLSTLEDLSVQLARLMTKYIVDKELARPATIAKLTGVHQSSVSSRVSGAIARQAWAEVWPTSKA
jgi:hypothetical protein